MRHNGQLMETTVGRLIFNEVVPHNMGYYNEVIDKKMVAEIIGECYRLNGCLLYTSRCV